MVPNVVLDERGYEVVAMVVVLLHPQDDGDPPFLSTMDKVVREELTFGEKVVRPPLVDEDVGEGRAFVGLHQFRGVPFLPLLTVWSKVASEGLLPPRAVDWVANRGEGGDGAVHAGILEGANKRPVPAHTVSENRLLGRIHVEVGLNEFGQL